MKEGVIEIWSSLNQPSIVNDKKKKKKNSLGSFIDLHIFILSPHYFDINAYTRPPDISIQCWHTETAQLENQQTLFHSAV